MYTFTFNTHTYTIATQHTITNYISIEAAVKRMILLHEMHILLSAYF
jgi:hypothetical protein